MTEPEEPKRKKTGCIAQFLIIFTAFWALWAVNALIISVFDKAEEFGLLGAILAAIASIGELLLLLSPDIARYFDSN